MYKSLVFLSCGQAKGERDLAKSVETMIKNDLKMDCYNADSVHGFDDVMSITDKLAIADYYVMIDFRRAEEVPLSVFTHQEFALARAWGLDRTLVFQEIGQSSHGMLKYVLAHPISFKREELVATVRDAIRKEGWESSYSRNLLASGIGASRLTMYKDHTGQYNERVWQLTIRNCRTDRAAVNTLAILDSIKECTTNQKSDSPDRSYLKWVDQLEGYQHTILPLDHAAFDAFAVHAGEDGVFLHSRHDTSPRQPVVREIGEYLFTYHVYSANFPLLIVPLRVKYTGPLRLETNVIDTATKAALA
jgi:hypothetical protein